MHGTHAEAGPSGRPSPAHRRPKTYRLPSISRDTAVDMALALVALTYSLILPLALLPIWRDANPEFSDQAPAGWELAAVTTLEVVAALALLVRRRLPVITALASTAALWLCGPGYTYPVALYTLVVRGHTRWAVGTGLAVAAVPVTPVPWIPESSGDSEPAPPLPLWIEGVMVTYWVPMLVVPVLVALTIHGLRSRTEQLQRERVLAARNARLEERARIARDLHDVVAHYVGLMVLQAGALEVRSGHDPATSQSAQLLGDLGRRAMGELRDLLCVLRPDDASTIGRDQADGPEGAQAGDGRDGEDGGVWRRDVSALVNQARLAGVPVVWHIDGEPEDAGAAARQIAYRVIQEGIANAARHASGAEVRIAVQASAQSLEISVRNGPSPESPPVPVTAAPAAGGGHGLTGMRERVSLAGGTLRAHPTPDGGFHVTASIPAEVPADPESVLALAEPRDQ